MSEPYGHYKKHKAFTLLEVLTALIIGAMVLVAALGIYNRAQRCAAAVGKKLTRGELPAEILERIAEDLSKNVPGGSDVKITIENKLANVFPTARMQIESTIFDKGGSKKTFEKIIWQANYNSDANSLIIYRSRSGIGSEDKLLDSRKQQWQRELFVPVCSGVTLFKIQAVKGEKLLDKWNEDSTPAGVIITISFAELVKTLDGTFDVPDSEKISRTIAINKTRPIKFVYVPAKNEPYFQKPGPNQP